MTFLNCVLFVDFSSRLCDLCTVLNILSSYHACGTTINRSPKAATIIIGPIDFGFCSKSFTSMENQVKDNVRIPARSPLISRQSLYSIYHFGTNYIREYQAHTNVDSKIIIRF